MIALARAASRGDRYAVTRVDTEDAFAALRGEWDDLLGRSDARSPFLRWGWLHSWWRAFGAGRDLRLYLAREAGGRLAGVAPLQRSREGSPWPLRVLSLLGGGRASSDFLDVIVARDAVEQAPAALWRAVAADDSEYDVVRFADLAEDSLLAAAAAPAATAAGWTTAERPDQICPYLPLPGSLETLLAARGKSLRDNYRRASKRLESLGTVFERVDSDDIPAALDDLYRLHEARWRRKGSEGNFRREDVRRFHALATERLGPDGAVRLYRLRLGARPLAMLYALERGGVLAYYQAGFDPSPPDASIKPHDYSPGIVLIGKVIGDAIERGLSEFDFLRGPEPAKFRWTPSYRTTRSLTLVPSRSWRGRVAFEVERAHLAARRTARRWLRRERGAVPAGGGR